MKNLVPIKHTDCGKKQSISPVSKVLSQDWFDEDWEDPFLDIMIPSYGISDSINPTIDVSEDKKEVTVRAELPGMSENDISVSLHDGFLEIQGEKLANTGKKGRGQQPCECDYSSFSRDIWLGNTVDGKGAKAHFKKGLLTIDLPKSHHAQKDVQIRVS